MQITRTVAATAFTLASLVSVPAFAQGQVQEAQARLQGTGVDLSGTWANRLHEDWIERGPSRIHT